MQPVHVALGIGGIAALGSAGAAGYLFNKTIVRGTSMDVTKQAGLDGSRWVQYFPIIKESKAWLKTQACKEQVITTFDGLRLRGTLLPAKITSKKLIIGLHGYKSKGESDFSALGRFYYELGYHVLIADHRAHGASEGKYVGFGVLDRRDCMEWIRLGIQEIGEDCEIYLHGISMGAATALMRGGLGVPKQVKGIIADCGFTSAWDVFKHVLKKGYYQPPFPILYLANTYSKHLAGYSFDEVTNLEEVKKITVPVLFIHGAIDDFVPTDMSRKMYACCQTPKELLIVSEAGHGESYYAARTLYEETVKTFIAKCEEER